MHFTTLVASTLATSALAVTNLVMFETDIHHPLDFTVHKPNGAYLSTCSGAAAFNVSYTTQTAARKNIRTTFDQFGAFWYSNGTATSPYLKLHAVQRATEWDASREPGYFNFQWPSSVSVFDLKTTTGMGRTMWVDTKKGAYTFSTDVNSVYAVYVNGKKHVLAKTTKPLVVQGNAMQQSNITVVRASGSKSKTGLLTISYPQGKSS